MTNLNFNVAVTGVPGTGKTTLCEALRSKGFKTLDLNKFAMDQGCLENEEVLIECVMEKIDFEGYILDGHYSHLLGCYCAIVTECDENVLVNRLRLRGYSKEKIEENIDCLKSDCIWNEAKDLLPYGRILRLNSEKKDSLNTALSFIERMRLNFNGTR